LLGMLREVHPKMPVVLVTEFASANARALKDVLVDEVVWSSEINMSLEKATKIACTRDLRLTDAIWRTVSGAEHVPVRVKEASFLLCHSVPPITSNQAAVSDDGYFSRLIVACMAGAGPPTLVGHDAGFSPLGPAPSRSGTQASLPFVAGGRRFVGG
jgi:hypothetical protein